MCREVVHERFNPGTICDFVSSADIVISTNKTFDPKGRYFSIRKRPIQNVCNHLLIGRSMI